MAKKSSSSDQLSHSNSDRLANAAALPKPDFIKALNTRATVTLPYKTTLSQDITVSHREQKRQGSIKKNIYKQIASKLASFFKK